MCPCIQPPSPNLEVPTRTFTHACMAQPFSIPPKRSLWAHNPAFRLNGQGMIGALGYVAQWLQWLQLDNCWRRLWCRICSYVTGRPLRCGRTPPPPQGWEYGS